jgi:hypothetical protein
MAALLPARLLFLAMILAQIGHAFYVDQKVTYNYLQNIPRQLPVNFNNVTVAYKRGWNVVADGDVEQGAHIIGIPFEDVISSFDVFEWSSVFPSTADPELVLIARLSYERVFRFNPYSWSNSYVHSYPLSMETPLNWTHAEVEFLHARNALPAEEEIGLHAKY